MKKIVLACALICFSFLSANAARIIDVPRGSITEFLGKYIVTIDHDDDILDFYRLNEGPPPSIVKVDSFPVLDESGAVITNIDSLKRMRITPGLLDLSSEAVTGNTRTLLVAVYRERIREGRSRKTILKTAIVNPLIDENDNISGLETIRVLDLGPQPIVRF